MQAYERPNLVSSQILDETPTIDREFAQGILLGVSCGLLLCVFVLAISYYFDLDGRFMIDTLVRR